MTIKAGDGNLNARSDGMTVGGAVFIEAGQSLGLGLNDDGGVVNIVGGAGHRGDGGNLTFASGMSAHKSSGSIGISTNNAGRAGVSGDVSIKTGFATATHQHRYRYGHELEGHSGSIEIETGDVKGIGRGGDIKLRVGISKVQDGGDVTLSGGDAGDYYGGDIDLFGGKGRRGGDINLLTLDDDSAGNDSTGEINIMTGDSEHGDSGEMKLVTGDG